MQTLYIAGPMAGIPEYNYPAFRDAERRLRLMGFDVLNPASNGEPGDHPERTWKDWMRLALGQLIQADGIALLEGWENSRGARLENQIAEELGMERFLLRQIRSTRERNLEAIQHEINTPLLSGECGTPLQKCIDVGFHQPPCRCVLPAGHDGSHLSLMSTRAGGR